MNDWIDGEMRELGEAVGRLQPERAALQAICEACVACLKSGGKLLTFGNGGSATDALHLAEELVGRYRSNRAPLPAICLNADCSALTCIANDFGFDAVFARQATALARPGDVAIAFSTSGDSANIVEGLRAAKAAGARTIGMLGKRGGKAREACDLAFVAPSANTARIQELHTFALHLICEAVEREYAEVRLAQGRGTGFG